MKRFIPILAVLLVAGCNNAPEASAPAAEASASTSASAAAPPSPAAVPAEAKRATATGVVQAIDTADNTITIAHGPIEALSWPGMTMAFQAPNIDLSTIKAGDEVTFEIEATGMGGTILSISKK